MGACLWDATIRECASPSHNDQESHGSIPLQPACAQEDLSRAASRLDFPSPPAPVERVKTMPSIEMLETPSTVTSSPPTSMAKDCCTMTTI